MRKYKERLRVVEALHFDGEQQDLMAVVSWIQENGYVWYDMFTPAPASGVTMDPTTGFLILVNKKGELASARKGDWVVKEPDGSFKTLSNEEFQSTYEENSSSESTTTVASETHADPAQLPPTPKSGINK